MWRSKFIALGTVLTLIGAGAIVPVQAQQTTPVPATQVPASPPTIIREPDLQLMVPELVIQGHVIMRLRSRAGGLTPEERALSLRQRLGPILTLPNLSASDVTVRQIRSGQTASIFVRDRLLITVDSNLAKANLTSVEGLAVLWAANLQQALPQINVTVRMSNDLLAAPQPVPAVSVNKP